MQTKRIFITTVLAFIVTMLITQSCGTSKPFSLNDLEGQWILKTMNGKEAGSLFARELPTLQFDFQAKSIFGTGGCNRYNGRFILINNDFRPSNIASTRMFCMEPNAENEYLKLLQQNSFLSIKEGVLRMTNDKKEIILEFVRGMDTSKAVTQQQISGNWRLTKLGIRDAAEVFNWSEDKIPTLTFDAESGRISGMAGCNRYSSTYTLEGNTLQVNQVVSTQMACPNLEGEVSFLQSLNGALQIAMPDNNTLKLVKNNQIVMEFKRELVTA